MIHNVRFLTVAALLTFISPEIIPAETPRWTRVLSGQPVGGPIALGSRTVTVTDDRSITCIDREGSFLWSGRLPGKATPFVSAVGEGYVCAVSSPGKVSLFSADGNTLWQISGSSDPAAPPWAGRDGRMFIPYRDSIRCFSTSGLQLWRISLPAPYTGPIGETGDGDLLVGCEESRLTIISPFGEVKETIILPSAPTALSPLPFGFAAGFTASDGKGFIDAWDVRSGRKAFRVWSKEIGKAVYALSSAPGTLFAAGADGTAAAMNATDGAPLWSVATGVTLSPQSRSFREYGQYYIAAPGAVCAISDSGSLLWSLRISDEGVIPVLGSDGSIYEAASGWQVRAWTGERRVSGTADTAHPSGYGILKGIRQNSVWFSHPDTEEVQVFFNTVSEALAAGTGKGSLGSDLIGVDEPFWARRLSAIVQGTSFSAAVPPGVRVGFFETEKARAASLLGQMGSAEYRDFLIDQAAANPGETMSLGLLYGLAASGGDRNGEVAGAVRKILRRSGFEDDAVNRAACDTLYALIRYAPDREAREYAAQLVSFTKAPYSPATQEYARQVIGNIVQ